MLTSLQFQVAFIALMSSGLARNQRFNRFPTIVALWLYAHGTHRRVIELFCKIGLPVSYHFLQRALKSLASENIKFIHTVLRNNETAFFASGIGAIICFDNLDHNATVQKQPLDNKSRLQVALRYIIVARNVPPGTLDPLPWLQARDRSTIRPEDLHVSAQDHAEIHTNWASALIDFLAEACPPVAAADQSTFLQASPSSDVLDPNAPATEVHVLKGPETRSKSVEDNIAILENYACRQFGIGSKALLRKQVAPIFGDLFTINRVRQIWPIRREETSFTACCDWAVPVSMPFHTTMTQQTALTLAHKGAVHKMDAGTLSTMATWLGRN
jgi:hypothetical protein